MREEEVEEGEEEEEILTEVVKGTLIKDLHHM